ncbi:hypothetical protein AAZX31_20G216800 [Glycine max]|uniref:Uncharacterized protein n=1 Tax=Glycine max TaxID=3847 RepID=I1NIW1_SOYBN|nr:chromosome partition protein Smc [Glycine max]KAH1192089.1 Laminin subunit beta-1 [Glycine max]KRG92804.1 hypothetical protein GLYMA_20G230700v4 [Glycine max]|eukprot:XP_006606499.1 uncharacterized protein LOC102662957 [Glycine max]
MAKKKVSESLDPMAAPTDDSSSALQIQNLKNLNALLLKETTQRRHQIHSLQSALHRSAVTFDTNLAFHLQNAVVSVFFKNQLQEMNLRFDTLLGDRDFEVSALKHQLSDLVARLENETTALAEDRDGLVRETKRLEASVDRERKLREEAEKVRSEGEEFLSRKQRDIAELETERDLAVKSSQESRTAIGTLKEAFEAVTREKSEIQSRNSALETKIGYLETELKQLNDYTRKEEEITRAKILELEGNLGIAMQKEEEMKMEISALLKEKKEVEMNVEMLTEEKDGVREALSVVQKELEDKQRELDEAVKGRNEIEEVKVNLENKIVELRGKVNELKESGKKFEEENKQSLSQVKRYENAVDEAVLEKDSIKKAFDEEKKKVVKLELLIAKTKEVAAKSDAELGQVRSERNKLVEKEKELEGNVSVLREENEALQGMLAKARKESKDLNAKVEVWCSNSNKALSLLKTTAAALVCQHKERGGDEVVAAAADENPVEEIQPYAQELDAIKKAFKTKDEMVDDMKQQLVSLNKSVAEAHKSKSLWTVISSATTIFAAVLAAYVARGR